MMLTSSAVKAARPRSRAYKMFDERGLHLHVATSGRATWRLKYRLAGHEQLATIGGYPEISLNDARGRADAAHQFIARGEKPPRPRAAQASTVEAIARAWHGKHQADWTEVHAGDVLASLERDVFPAIGAIAVDRIAPSDVRELLEDVEGRGCIETARRLRQRLEAVFDFARAHGAGADNPARDIGAALSAARPKRAQPALVTLPEVRALLAAAERDAGGPIPKLASRFLALTAVRLDAVRGARWDEIEDLDGPAPLWRVPAARMKLRRAKKQLAAHDHFVPLAPAAVRLLFEARCYAGDGLIFPGNRRGRPIGEGTIGDLYDRAGYAGRHVPHGWRASFSTIMNEAVPDERALIDQALGHTLKSEDGREAKVEGAYNRAAHLARRRALFEQWAAFLIDI